MHIIFTGAVGCGKTNLAVQECIRDDGDFIYSNIGLNQDLVDKVSKRPKKVVEYDNFEQLKEAVCGAWLVDEAHLFLDARKYDSLDQFAKRKLIEHRKDDLAVYSTTQDLSFIDKVFRVLADEVRVVSRFSLPLVGFIWPRSRRPSIICKHCNRYRRDGIGDDSTWWKRCLGFGTVFRWKVYPPTIIKEAEQASGEDIEDIKCKGVGWRLFDIRFASTYDSGAKVSEKARIYLSTRFKRRSGKVRVADHAGAVKSQKYDNGKSDIPFRG